MKYGLDALFVLMWPHGLIFKYKIRLFLNAIPGAMKVLGAKPTTPDKRAEVELHF